MNIGDLVCDPHVMRSKYAFTLDRTAGLIISDESEDHTEPKSYCGCYKDKFLVWWIKANAIFEQCECELKVISRHGEQRND